MENGGRKVTLVGFGYKARHGKGTAARAIHCTWPKETWIFSLADALKSFARIAGFMDEKDGPLLQVLGTDVIRRRNPARFIDTLSRQIDEFSADYGNRYALVTDVRFPNEADWIVRSGGFMVNVLRTAADGSTYVSPDRPATHESEVALDEYVGWHARVTARSGDMTGLAAKSVEAFHALTKAPMPQEDVEGAARRLVLAGRSGFGTDFHKSLRELDAMLS